MNARCFKTVFSKRLGALVAVGEHAASQGKAQGASCAAGAAQAGQASWAGWSGWGLFVGALTTSFALVTLAWAQPAVNALPTGGQVVQGAVQFNQSAQQLNIQQGSDRAAVNWQSFDIGAAAKVNVVQPSAQSVLLNRVGGESPSQIFGQLTANGQVILVNPNGMVFGRDGSVSAAGFTGSTLNISDADFMAGKERYTRQGSAAVHSAIVNRGLIQAAPGGYVALLGASVSNEGRILAPQGNVFMAAADAVTLPSPTVGVPIGQSGRIKLELTPASINAAVANHKDATIVTEGGQVYLQAAAINQAMARIIQSGSIDTTGVQGGQVHVLADGGHIRVGGSIKANSTGRDDKGQAKAGGDIYIGRDKDTNVLAAVGDASGARLESKGGFVETSGQHLVTTGTRVLAKDWLLDPFNITIASSGSTTAGASPLPDYSPSATSTILASDIVANLDAGTNVTVTTAGAGADAGNITVNADIVKTTTGTASLSLRADNNITVNNRIGAGVGATGLNVTLRAGQSIATTTTGQIVIATGGSIDAKAGNVILQTKGGMISNASGATVTGAHITLDNTNGAIDAATGSITKGTSLGASGTNAITIGENITATGNLRMYGLTANNMAISLAAAKTLSGGNIQAVGDTGAVFGLNIGSGASIVTTANSGNSLITGIGRSTGGGGSGTLALVNATIRAAAGSTLEMKGQAVGVTAGAPGNTRGIRIDGVIDTYGAITLTGESGSTEGVLVQAGNINIREGSLTINGTMTPNGGGWRNGITLSRPISLFNNTTLTMVGKAANTGAMTANQFEYGVGIASTISSAAGQTGGDVSITGFTSSAQDSFGVNINSSISTGGSIRIVGQNLGNSAGAAVRIVDNTNLTSGTGDVTIQSIGGRIQQSSGSTITGRHITIDNTGAGLNSLITDTTAGLNLTEGTAMGGSIDPTTRAITPGAGQHVFPTSATAVQNVAVSLSGALAATGNINIHGAKSIAGTGVDIASAASLISSGVGAQIQLATNRDLAHAGAIRVTGSNGTGATIGLTSSSGGINGLGAVGNSTHKNAAVNFSQGATSTYGGSVHASTFAKNGAGRLQITGSLVTESSNSINQGTLQIGTGGTAGSMTANTFVASGAVLEFNRSDAYTMSAVVSGAGSLIQSGTGTTTLTADNSYSGATNITGGTLQVGSGGSTGNLGTTSGVTLSNNTQLTFNRSVNTTIDRAISGNGNVTANITGGLVMGSSVNLTGTNSINLTASGAITQTSGTLAATNLNMTSTSGAIGSAGQRVQTNVANLSVSAGGDVFVTEADAVLVAGRTTSNNGSLDIRTTNGTLHVGSFNSLMGLTAHGSGNITVSGSASTGNGIFIAENISATDGDVSITGTTSSAVNPNAGVLSDATVQARNITLAASATAAGGGALGYYGAGGVFTASEGLTLSGSAAGSGNGFYTFIGDFSSGTGMAISGTSAQGQGVGLDNAVTLTNSGPGGIGITGTANGSNTQAIGLRGTAFTNNAGDVALNAVNGQIFSSAGNPAAWGGVARANTITNSGSGLVRLTAGNNSGSNAGAIDGSVLSITQNGNAGVVVRTSGTGHVTAPKIANAGTGDIVVAAGSAIAAGMGTGGQVLTVAGNTLTQTNGTPGKTYVFTGAPESTGLLSRLSSGFDSLFYQGTSQPLNTAFNTAFDANPADNMSVPGGGSASNTQVFFRTATRPGFSLTLANNSKVYGEADPTTWVSTNGATLTNAVAGIGGSNTFAVSTANVLAGLSGGRETGEDVGTYAYNLSANNFNTSLTAQPNLVIGKRDITLTSLTASNRVYDGTTQATITGGTFGNLHNAETLFISGVGEFANKDAADGKVVTVANVSTLTKTNGTGNWNNYNLTTTSKTTTANISKATLTATANNDARFVTQNDAANFNGVSLSGFVGGDTLADINVSGLAISRTNAVNDVAAGSYVGVLVPSGLTAVNYNFNYVNGDYTIVPANRLLVRTDSQSLVYGTAPIFNTTAEYLDSSDNLIKTLTRSGSNNNYVFNDGAGTSISMSMKPYVGTTVAAQSTSGQTVVGSFDVKGLDYTQTGTNFVGVPLFMGRLDVTPKAVTPSASGVSKVYDGTTAMSNVVVGMTGKLTGDVVTISGTGAFGQKDVGTGLSYSVSNVVLTGADSANYYLANGSNSFSGTDGVITRAFLVATANSLSTTFNGAAQSVSGFTVSGLVGGDSVNDLVGISASGATGTNVGSYANTMTVADQTNYTVTGVDGALVIHPAPITITGISGALTGTVTKVYDGTNSAVLSPANYVLTGWLGSDGATVTKTAGTYNNANVGVGKPVTVSLSRADFLASGATDLSNYSLPTSVTGPVGVITPKEVSLSSLTVADKVYDGSTLATITSGTVLTGVGSETLSVRGMGTFADKHVGDAKLVTPSDVSSMTKLDGSGSWLNYKLVNSNVTGRASITPKTIQASGLVADKVYDGSVAATVNGMAAVGVVTGDTVFVQAGSAAFADKDVSRDAAGTIAAKVVTVSGLSLAGLDARNYVLDQNTFTAQARITPKALQISAQALDKVYDSTPLATIKLGGLTGLVGAEQLQVMAAGAFENAEVGTNKWVNVRFELGNGPHGGLATNYELAPQILRASIANPSAMPSVQPSPVPAVVKPASSAVTFAGPALAAVGEQVSAKPAEASCDLLNVEDCACEQSKLDHVLICYVPRDATATGRVLPNNTGASVK